MQPTLLENIFIWSKNKFSLALLELLEAIGGNKYAYPPILHEKVKGILNMALTVLKIAYSSIETVSWAYKLACREKLVAAVLF